MNDFIGFLVAAGLPKSQLYHSLLLAFMEYLGRNNISLANIYNYLAGIRAQVIIYNHSSPTSATTTLPKVKENNQAIAA